MPAISALGRSRKENHNFEFSIGYIARPYLKKQTRHMKTKTKTRHTNLVLLSTVDAMSPGSGCGRPLAFYFPSPPTLSQTLCSFL
jgi:hypothetical protein